MAYASPVLGPWVRLEGIYLAQLPSGGKAALGNSSSKPDNLTAGSKIATAPNLDAFVTSVLSEAIPFIDGVAPKSGGPSTWRVKGSPKIYASSKAAVHLYERRVPGEDLDNIEGINPLTADRKDETWFCRRSCHKNKKERGTASWEEFTHSFKEHHAETEDAFTPAVIGAREAIRWDTSGVEVVVRGERWTNVTVAVQEMKHRINPKPLQNRTFPIVQVTAELADTQEFTIVSIPLADFEKSPCAEFARDKSLVVAAYVSIERIRVLPGSGDVEWIMATASDAGGVLPQWMQNLAVPSAIAKDVEMFLAWIPSQRKDKRSSHSKTGSADKELPAIPSNGVKLNGNSATVESINKDLPAAPSE